MTLPGTSLTKKDGALGLTAPAASKALVIGPSSGGTKETLYTFAQTNKVNETIGWGPAQVAAELMLAVNGGSVDVYVSSASIAATRTNVVSSSSPAITNAGTANDTYDFIGSITKAGALDVAKWKYSLDGGQNYSPDLTVVGNYTLANSGLSLTFATGSYVNGASFTFSTKAAQMNATDLATCINDFKTKASTPTLILVANDSQSAVSGSALFMAMDGHLTTLDNLDVYTSAIVPTGGTDAGTSATLTAFSTVQSSAGNTAMAVAERARVQVASPFMGYANPRVPFAFPVAARAHGVLISTNPARVADGGLSRTSSPTYDEFLNGEVYLPANLAAPRSFNGSGGVFLNQALLKSAPGSDYKFWQWGRVINRAAQVTQVAVQRYINSFVRTLTDGTGRIDPRDAANIEADVNAQLNAAIMTQLNAQGFLGHATALQFSVNRENNVLTTSEIQCTTIVVPLANVSNATIGISFTTSIPVTAVAG